MVWRKGAKAEDRMPSTRFEVLLSEEADRAGTMGPPIFYKVTLPQTEAGALLQLLSMHELDGATLFPGFDGVARVVRERIYWEGYEGTDAQPFHGELEKRRMELADRHFQQVPIYDTRYKETDDDYSTVRNMIAATRSVLDAGDYDPKLAERIGRLEEVQSSCRLRSTLYRSHRRQTKYPAPPNPAALNSPARQGRGRPARRRVMRSQCRWSAQQLGEYA
jgi:hypothetical protein